MDRALSNRGRWIAIALLVWNLIGVGMFVSQYLMTTDDIAKLPSTQQFLWTHMSARIWIAYAAAVGAGTLGALGLLLRKSWALWLSTLGLIALIVQFTNPVLLHIASEQGLAIMAFPLFIIAIAGFQTWLSWRWRSQH